MSGFLLFSGWCVVICDYAGLACFNGCGVIGMGEDSMVLVVLSVSVFP